MMILDVQFLSLEVRNQRKKDGNVGVHIGLNPIRIEETTVTGHCFFRARNFERLDLCPIGLSKEFSLLI